MKITEAMFCVNRVQCNHCQGFGTFIVAGEPQVPLGTCIDKEEKCSVCAGDGDYECGEIVLQGTLSCPSCTGTTFLRAIRIQGNPKLHALTHPKDTPIKKPF